MQERQDPQQQWKMTTMSPSLASSVTVLHHDSNKGNKGVHPGILPKALPGLVLLVLLQSKNSNEGVLHVLLVPIVQQNRAVGIIVMKKNKGVLSMLLVLQQG